MKKMWAFILMITMLCSAVIPHASADGSFAQAALLPGTELRTLYDSIFNQNFNAVANLALSSVECKFALLYHSKANS